MLTVLRRELYEQLASLRFALGFALAAGLLLLNAVVFANGDFARAMQDYIGRVDRYESTVQERAGDLSQLAIRGPGYLHKRPSPLSFVATGRDHYLPAEIQAETSSSRSGLSDVNVYLPWYPRFTTPASPPATVTGSELVAIDWFFVVGFAMSLLAVLLTFDSISGERQRGTLRLMLSGPVSRAAVLTGKYLAALIALATALVVGVLLNFLTINLLGGADFSGQDLGKLGAAAVSCLLYLAFFTGIGLAVSSLFERPASCLVALLLVWTALVILVPNTTAGVIHGLVDVDVDPKAQNMALDATWEEHGLDVLARPDVDPLPRDFIAKYDAWAEEHRNLGRKFEEEFLRAQLAQVELGQGVARLTPVGVFQYALESLSDTGLPRHYRFIETARRYEGAFRDFVRAEDASDPDSHHLLGLAEGMSHKAVAPESVPLFKENLSAAATIDASLPDLLILALFAVAAFMAAYLAFARLNLA